MEAVLNKGESVRSAILCLKQILRIEWQVFLCSVAFLIVDLWRNGDEIKQWWYDLHSFVFLLDEVAAYELKQKEAEEKKERLYVRLK